MKVIFNNHVFKRLMSALSAAALGAAAATAQESGNPVVKSGFIYDENPPTPSCHASTIEQAHDGHLVAAWFGGLEEGSPDVSIWLAHHNGRQWTEAEKVADGWDEDKRRRYPCWNPVLFQPSQGPLLLFYKVGPNPREWWGMLKKSKDNGKTWSEAKRLRKGIYGPIRNKPIELSNGTILCGSSTEDAGWRVHMEFGRQYGKYWERTEPLHNAMEVSAIQPAILNWGKEGIQILCRTKQDRIAEFWSQDKGQTWSTVEFTELPNPNSGIDAVKLNDNRGLLVYNHTRQGRSPLNVALTEDGKSWAASLVLEDQPGEYSYPAVIQTRDGFIHVTYTWKRKRIKHVVLHPYRLPSRPMSKGIWR